MNWELPQDYEHLNTLVWNCPFFPRSINLWYTFFGYSGNAANKFKYLLFKQMFIRETNIFVCRTLNMPASLRCLIKKFHKKINRSYFRENLYLAIKITNISGFFKRKNSYYRKTGSRLERSIYSFLLWVE